VEEIVDAFWGRVRRLCVGKNESGKKRTVCVYSNRTIGWGLVDLVRAMGLAIDDLLDECLNVGVGQ